MSCPNCLTVEQAVLISAAAREIENDGLMDTTTYIALNNSGVDADNIQTLIEETSK